MPLPSAASHLAASWLLLLLLPPPLLPPPLSAAQALSPRVATGSHSGALKTSRPASSTTVPSRKSGPSGGAAGR